MRNHSSTRLILIFALLLAVRPLFSQYYNTGQDPASIRWMQIKTRTVRIIYPEGADPQGAYLAHLADLIRIPETKTLRAKVPRIPFILHNRSAISNGYTTWAPKRIELYTTPPPDCYAEEWLEQLALHEYRHAVQISKMNQGFTKGLYFLLGEQATGGVLGLFTPRWFLEGDATATETALSNSGRGRIPSFAAPLRAQILEIGPYRYDKATLGSYKNYVPNSYILGYHLVAKGRVNHGADFWNLPLDRTAKYPFMVVPFASGIRSQTSMTKTRFYRSVMHEFDSIWKVQEASDSYFEYCVIAPQPERSTSVYIEYDNPAYLNDSLVIAEKSSLDETDRIITIDAGGKERRLLITGSYESGSLTTTSQKAVWAEYQPDPRWQNRSYSILRWMNTDNRKRGRLTRRSRYFSPNLSPDGNSVCAVHADDLQHSRIDILTVPDGKILKQIEVPGSTLLLEPAWDRSSRKIYFILLGQKGKSLAVTDTASGTISLLTEPSFHEISGPVSFGRYVLFNADYSGIENIYAIDTASCEVFRVTSTRFGSSDPSAGPQMQKILFLDYSSRGYGIVTSDFDTSAWIPLERIRDHSYPLYKSLAEQENANIQDSSARKGLYRILAGDDGKGADPGPGTDYRPKRYRKFPHLFNIHSWAPLSIDITNQTVSPGVSVMLQNLLSSLMATAGYRYDLNEETGNVYLNLSYQGWYPVFDLDVSYGKRASYYVPAHSSEHVRFTWMETNFGGSVSIPWNFTRGKFYRYLRPAIGTTLVNVVHNASTPSSFVSGLIQSVDYSLSASQYLRSVPKDMFAKWGQQLLFNFRNTPFTANDLGSIIALQTYLYFPGLFRHHSFWLYGGVQERGSANINAYRYSTIVRYPFGYNNAYDDKLFSAGINYKLPLFYPDLSLGSVLYIKRFKLNLFFDFAQGWNPGELNIYKSTGATLSMDFHLLRFVAPIEAGVRSIFFPDQGTWGWEFVYSINY